MKQLLKTFLVAGVLFLLPVMLMAQEKTQAYYNRHESEILPDARVAFQRGEYERTVELCKWHYIIVGDRAAESLRNKAERCAQLSREMAELQANDDLKAAKDKANAILALNPNDDAAKAVLQTKEPVSEVEVIETRVETTEPAVVVQESETKEEHVDEGSLLDMKQIAQTISPDGVPGVNNIGGRIIDSEVGTYMSIRGLRRASNDGDARAQAILAYLYKEGHELSKDLKKASFWAQKAAQSRDGLGYWLCAQIAREKGLPPSAYGKYLMAALREDYPLAISFFARVFASGNEAFTLEKDDSLSFNLGIVV